MEELIKIQGGLKAPKSQFNKFGNYNYRKCRGHTGGIKAPIDRKQLRAYIVRYDRDDRYKVLRKGNGGTI